MTLSVWIGRQVSRSAQQPFWTIVLFALLVRVVAVVLFPEGPWADAIQFDAIAHNLVNGNGYSMAKQAPFELTMYREPGYPLFLALAYWLPGPDVPVAKALQILLSALTCGLVYQFAICARLRRGVAITGGLIAGLHPALALYSGHVLSESLAAFNVALALWAFARAWQSRKPLDFALAGVASGLMALGKSTMIPLPFCMVVLYIGLNGIAARRDDDAHEQATPVIRSFALSAAFVAAMVCTIAPWSIRNAVLFGNPALSVRGGEVLWARAQTLSRDEITVAADMYAYWDVLRARGLSETQTDSQMAREGMALIKAEPLRYLSMNAAQVRTLWICSGNSQMLGAEGQACSTIKNCLTTGLRSLAGPAFWGLALLMIYGGVLLMRKAGAAYLPVLTVVFLTAVQSFFTLNSCRYAVPVLPAVALLFAQGLCHAFAYIRGLRVTSPPGEPAE